MPSQATKAQSGALTRSLWEVLVVCVSPACARAEGKRVRIYEGFQRRVLGTLISFHMEAATRALLLDFCHSSIHQPGE